MLRFWLKVIIYMFAFIISLFGLSALDFNRFLKKGKVRTGQVLYLIISFIMAYLLGNFIINLIYYL